MNYSRSQLNINLIISCLEFKVLRFQDINLHTFVSRINSAADDWKRVK